MPLAMLAAVALLALLANAQPCVSVTHLEWRELNTAQQDTYLQAVKCLKNATSILPESIQSPSVYDDLVYSHWKAGTDVHSTAAFLPWHRLMLYYHDSLIRSKCSYTGPMPYWDWAMDSQSLQDSPIWKAFGSDGRSSDDCVSDGPFSSFAPVFPEKERCVTRQLTRPQERSAREVTGVAFAPVLLQYVHSATTYNEFRQRLEELPHNKYLV